MNRLAAIALALCLLSGCASIDFDYPRTTSSAIVDTKDTPLGQSLAEFDGIKSDDESGFYPLSDGIDALGVRLLLASTAQKSIDLQYYLIKTDTSSRALIYSLLEAADRGVRVRLLLDDVFTKGYDFGLAGLDSHPNIEIRIFNPFYRGFAGKLRSGLTNFSRVNRRMHNKSFTVDNQMTIVGGRNIADEYFGAREDAKFSDLDVLGVGPVVQDVSTMFDTYWNHETALPVPAFASMPDDPAAELNRIRDGMDDWRAEVTRTVYGEALRQDIEKFMATDNSVFDWAPYELVYDSPDKGIKKRSEEADSIRTSLAESLASATKQVVIISPYFVPRKTFTESLVQLKRSGVDVTIITNSLAANNQFTVHSGYRPSRKPLLKAGVKIYEVRPDADVAGAELVAASGAKATLHTKAFLVDDREVFIGSFNFDPRSAYINTESGVIIRSEQLAAQFERAVRESIPYQSYELFLNEDDKLRWRDPRPGVDKIWDKEPETTWGQRFAVGFVALFPIRGQL